jgi:tetratricopeptide (TPR) repeat protein
VNRDNALFALGGVLVGFVAAYFAFEAMSTRQPPLRPPGQAAAAMAGAAEPGGGDPGAAAGPGGAPGSGPAVAEIRRLRDYVDSHPEDAEAILNLANLNLDIRDLVRARGLFEQYVKLRPDDTQARLVLANLCFDTKEYAAAREAYETYLESQPENPDILTDLGVSYRNLGQPQKALELFRRAEGLQPDHWVSRYNEVVVLAFDLKDFAAAGKILDELKALQPDNPDVANLAAEVERRRGAGAGA